MKWRSKSKFTEKQIMNIAEFDEIIEPNDQTEARKEHLGKLRELIGNVYPNKFDRSKIAFDFEKQEDEKAIEKEDTVTRILKCEAITKHIPNLAEGERPAPEVKETINQKLKEFGNVKIAGRVATPPRIMGKAAFVHLSDGKNRLQVYCRKGDFTFFGVKEIEAETNEQNPQTAVRNPHWEAFSLLDHGDFVGVEGFLFLTNTGELSVHVEKLQFLAKAMLPMPDKIHGISDPELQRRFRYADLIADSLKIDHAENELTTREVFERRAKLISGMRRFLDDAGFIEVETPMLTPKATGAAAKPFETHHDALGIPLYARIAPELYLKRLTVGGFEKVYELNRNFRNEGLSFKHNPEFTMLEFYYAYMDVNGMMDFGEAMIKESVQKAAGSLQVKYGENEIDFSKFERLSMKDSIANQWKYKRLGSDDFDRTWLDNPEMLIRLYLFNWILNTVVTRQVFIAESGLTKEQHIERQKKFQTEFANEKKDEVWIATSYLTNDELIERKIKGLGIDDDDYQNIEALNYNLRSRISQPKLEASLTELLFERVEEKLIQPTFIIDYPKSISPLSKASPENPQIAERFELFINGMECANGFSELNDPQEQYERFREQMNERETGDDEAMVMDEDYIRALSYGMPPAAGIGIGIDRLVMLLTNRHSIRDVILFPHMRPDKKNLTAEDAENAEEN